MEGFRVRGGEEIKGQVRLEGAKNAVLPILAAALLPEGDTVIRDCPDIRDVHAMAEILGKLGCRCAMEQADILDAVRAELDLNASLAKYCPTFTQNAAELQGLAACGTWDEMLAALGNLDFGKLLPGQYSIRGDVSSQYITGLLLALSALDAPSEIRVIPDPYLALYPLIDRYLDGK